MGYTYRNNGHITDFWPDNTENEFYLCNESPMSLKELVAEIDAYWEGVNDLDQIEISSEEIHTSCLTYDGYDSSDYTQFLVIRRVA